MTKVLKKYFSVKKSWLQLRKVDKLTFSNENRKNTRETYSGGCSWILKIKRIVGTLKYRKMKTYPQKTNPYPQSYRSIWKPSRKRFGFLNQFGHFLNRSSSHHLAQIVSTDVGSTETNKNRFSTPILTERRQTEGRFILKMKNQKWQKSFWKIFFISKKLVATSEGRHTHA